MMRVWIGAVLISLAGCASQTSPQPPAVGKPPAGFVRMLSNEQVMTYADLHQISSYQGNSHLRRFYIINNYTPQTRIKEKPPIYIASSRVINVINCDTQERAQFEHIFFSQPYGQGEVVTMGDAVGQWHAFPKDSLMGMMADMICKIDPARLKPEPAKETRVPLLG
ncbi:surface-adhesin E family protein [Pantoea sp. B65]|uniref:surface-adhesin E family protein n=1 Tax=Pantoea sp. B65 TaxID=2813359 RepID=UPI0039B69AFE